MESRPGSTVRRRMLIVPFAGAVVIAAIAIPLAIHAGIEADLDSSPVTPIQHTQPVDGPASRETSPATEATGAPEDDVAIPFGRFPLDQGWAETYGRNLIDGPDPGAGGISMPEGHCNEEVLFGSGYQDKLSTYVATGESSRTREILGYADPDALRSAFRALVDAVASCASFGDPSSGEAVYSAEAHESIDAANARAGVTTFTFAYTSTGTTPSGVLYQFAIVRDVLYGSNDYGEWTRETASAGLAALNEENASLIALMSRIQR